MPRKANPNSKSTKQSRLAMCGTPSDRIENGMLVPELLTCKDWRNCPYCFNVRMHSWLNIVMNGMEHNGGGLIYTSFSWDNEELFEKMTKRIQSHKACYIAFRSEDKIHLLHTDNDEDGIKMTYEELITLDWKAIVLTKEDRRISATGFFREKPIKVIPLDIPQVKTLVIQTDAPANIKNETWIEARIECNDPIPETLEDEFDIVKKIARRFDMLMSEKGYKTLFLSTVRYKDWSGWKPLPKLSLIQENILLESEFLI